MPTETTAAPQEVAELRERYQEARSAIAGFDDPLEREVGFATLRLEGEHTVQQLRTTAVGLTEADLQPLTTLVGSLSGGENAERAVKSVDKVARSALKDVTKSLESTTVLGGGSVVIGALLWIFNLTVDAGSAAAAGVLALGGVGFFALLRGTQAFGPEMLKAAEQVWERASGLGEATEREMARPREMELQIWRRAAGAPWRYTPFALRARRRATAIVIACAAAIGFAASGFAYGAYSVVDQKTSPPDLSSEPWENDSY